MMIMVYECNNCGWKGEELSSQPMHRLAGMCPACGDNVKGAVKDDTPKITKGTIKKVGSLIKEKVEGDLDGNGIGYEKADISIAAKIMGKSKKKRGKR
jgi:hypothetical protein